MTMSRDYDCLVLDDQASRYLDWWLRGKYTVNALREEDMITTTWGLLGPEVLATERRTRTLGLNAAVRWFNDLAVPGLGGVWFGKQLFLALLGIAVADRVRSLGHRVRNIEVANAVEALACWLALNSTGWKSNPRLRGATKMRNKTDLAFAQMRKPSFYVTQPMRQATVQPLRAFGLVDSVGERFNAFICTQAGYDFITATCGDLRPFNRSVVEHLVGWAMSAHDKVKTSWHLTTVLSPLGPMPAAARELLRERIVQGSGVEAIRRRKAMSWVEQLRDNPPQSIDWQAKPVALDESHWRDLHAGALFFNVRDAAIRLLDQIESHIANAPGQQMSLDSRFPDPIRAKISLLRNFAHAFIENEYDPSPDREATRFCRECSAQVDSEVLENLLAREGRVLRWCGRAILPGVAFRGFQVAQTETARSPEEDGADVEIGTDLALPEGISYRVRNLYLLNLDLHAELDNGLVAVADEGGDEQ
ncbi:MAG: hypothetical protein ABSG53_13025 [Thermoguttaceae bacterium]